MSFDFKEILTTFMVLFAVIDIVGNIPIIIDLRKKAGHIQSGKASVIAGIIMIIFLFLGESILTLIGIDVHSFAVAGAFILFFIALEMILGITLYKQEEGTAMNAVCTHTGCDVTNWDPDNLFMACPCHESKFDVYNNAKVVGGPAPRPLAVLPLRLDGDAIVIADIFQGRVGFTQQF